MNIKNQYTRRNFLKLGSKVIISLPVILVFGCEIKKTESLSTVESLKKIILIIGPWSESEREKAKDFIERYIRYKHADKYLTGSGKILQSLAVHLSSHIIAANLINLKELSQEERELLQALAKQLYSFVEVRYYVSKEPSWGQCQGNNWHTRKPDQDRS